MTSPTSANWISARRFARRNAKLSSGNLVLMLAIAAAGPTAIPTKVSATTAVLYVSVAGNDAGPGSIDAPFRTLGRGIAAMRAGDTLLVRGGTYVENIRSPSISPGRADARIRVAAYPAERVVVQGLLWLKGADYWTLDGINVTWSTANTSTEHMVKMTNGVGWQYVNAELWGARSFAGILVAGTVTGQPANWVLRGNCIHDTVSSNRGSQDHNIYINTGTTSGPGLIERNILFNAPNGTNIKVGYGRADPQSGDGAANVTIRYNTMFGALKNVLLADDTHHIALERNIIKASEEGYAIRAYRLTGTNNVFRNNVFHEFSKLQYADAGYRSLTDGGGNLFPLDPSFNNVGCAGFQPQNMFAELHGRYADAGDAVTQRLAGADRYATAAAISKSRFGGGASTVFMATGASFADALAGAPAAAKANGPILLTANDALPSATAIELARLKPSKIVILGGSAAVSSGVASRLGSYASTVTRWWGADRYATAAAVSKAAFTAGVPVAYIATGSSFPDALSGGAIAGRNGGPILLVKQGALPGATATELARLKPSKIVILGGTSAVSSRVADALRRYATSGSVTRLAGADRYTTAVQVSRASYGSAGSDSVFIATGSNYPDGLAGGPVAALVPGPILLVNPTGLPSVVASELDRLDPARVFVLGGTSAISDGVVRSIDAILP